MTTPRIRHWKRTSGPRVWSGLLLGLGIIILATFQFLKPELAKTGFLAGMLMIVIGGGGLLALKRANPD